LIAALFSRSDNSSPVKLAGQRSFMTKTTKNSGTRGGDAVVTFKKMAAVEALPPQAQGILEIVKKAGKITVAELKKGMKAKITTKQSVGALWSFYRNRLIKGGYLTATKATRSNQKERS
jgi:hypothetical protein